MRTVLVTLYKCKPGPWHCSGVLKFGGERCSALRLCRENSQSIMILVACQPDGHGHGVSRSAGRKRPEYYSWVQNDRALFADSSNEEPHIPTPHAQRHYRFCARTAGFVIITVTDPSYTCDSTRLEVDRHMDNELLLLRWDMAALTHSYSASIMLGNRARCMAATTMAAAQPCVELRWRIA